MSFLELGTPFATVGLLPPLLRGFQGSLSQMGADHSVGALSFIQEPIVAEPKWKNPEDKDQSGVFGGHGGGTRSRHHGAGHDNRRLQVESLHEDHHAQASHNGHSHDDHNGHSHDDGHEGEHGSAGSGHSEGHGHSEGGHGEDGHSEGGHSEDGHTAGGHGEEAAGEGHHDSGNHHAGHTVEEDAHGHAGHATDGAHGAVVYPPVLVCDGLNGHHTHHVGHFCHFWSVAILAIFLIEICLKIWAMPGWLGDPMHKLDFAVVSLSLFVDVVVMWYLAEQETETGHQEREAAEIVALLLIICRFWRVVRIVHGFYEISNEFGHVKHGVSQEFGGEHDGHDGGHDKHKKEHDSI
jgi:hypothetical protein